MRGQIQPFGSRKELELGDLRYSIYFETERLVSGVATVPPKGRGGLDEGHPGAEEVFTICEGSITVTFPDGEETIELAPGDALLIPPGVPHQVENHGDLEAVFVFTVSPHLKG